MRSTRLYLVLFSIFTTIGCGDDDGDANTGATTNPPMVAPSARTITGCVARVSCGNGYVSELNQDICQSPTEFQRSVELLGEEPISESDCVEECEGSEVFDCYLECSRTEQTCSCDGTETDDEGCLK